MKKERQIGVRVGLPSFFALELEDVYRHTEGAHRALAFPDFIGLLVGLGLEAYRKGTAPPEGKDVRATRRLGEISAALESKKGGDRRSINVRAADIENSKTATLSGAGVSRQRTNELR